MKEISLRQLLVIMVIILAFEWLVLDFMGGGDLFLNRFARSCNRSCNTTTTSHVASETDTTSRKPATNKYGATITTTWKSPTRSKSWTTTRRRKTTIRSNDPYNAKDYYHAEDFYDDHIDDFYDYYDAENYYNQHAY